MVLEFDAAVRGHLRGESFARGLAHQAPHETAIAVEEHVAMGTKQDLRKAIDEAIDNLEQVAGEVRLKIHLAEMETRDAWEKTLEPRLLAARGHAKEATAASKAAIDETVQAIREFSRVL